MIKAYCHNGYRNKDRGVDLENILKKATDDFFSLELGNGIKQKEAAMWLTWIYLLKNIVLFLLIKRIWLFVEIFKTKKSIKKKMKITHNPTTPKKLLFFSTYLFFVYGCKRAHVEVKLS